MNSVGKAQELGKPEKLHGPIFGVVSWQCKLCGEVVTATEDRIETVAAIHFSAEHCS